MEFLVRFERFNLIVSIQRKQTMFGDNLFEPFGCERSVRQHFVRMTAPTNAIRGITN